MSQTTSKTQTGGRDAAALAITPPQIVGPFYPVSERPDLGDETRATTSALGASTTLYRLACTDEEAWRRIERRNRNLNGDLFISRETFEALRARFEPLSDDEERIDIPVDPWPIISGWRYRIP
jgi:hypothetical protein